MGPDIFRGENRVVGNQAQPPGAAPFRRSDLDTPDKIALADDADQRVAVEHRDRTDAVRQKDVGDVARSEEPTSELQSLMRISYAVFCLQKKNTETVPNTEHQ